MTQWLWRTIAAVALVLGLAGVLLPILPTVPFLIVSAWAGSKGWPWLERYLLEHPRYGESIRRWRTHGIVPRRAKVGASLMMAVSLAATVFTPVPTWAKVGIAAMLACIATWLWRRPEVER